MRIETSNHWPIGVPETILDDAFEDYNRSKIVIVRLENATQVSISYMFYFIFLKNFVAFYYISFYCTAQNLNFNWLIVL